MFLQNFCQYNNCKAHFTTLMELIEHIESTHITFDQAIQRELEREKLLALPLSYVLPFTTPERREQLQFQRLIVYEPEEIIVDDEPECEQAPSPAQSTSESNTETNIAITKQTKVKELTSDSESEDSDSPWCHITTNFILRNHYRLNPTDDKQKSYACPVPNCFKLYKNANGIKYHAKHGHKHNTQIPKPFRCYCGKSYLFKQQLIDHKRKMQHIRRSTTAILNSTKNVHTQRKLPTEAIQTEGTDVYSAIDDWLENISVEPSLQYNEHVIHHVLLKQYPLQDDTLRYIC